MPHINKILFALILCVCLSMTAANGSDNRALLFTAPPTAAALGHGTVASPGAMDASDIYRFTVNSTLADGTQFIAGLTGSDGARTSYGALAMPILYSGAVGVFIHNISPEINGTANTFGLSLARYSPKYSSGIGGHIAFTQSDIFGGNEHFAAFGLDFRVDPLDILSGRVYYLHSGIPLRFNDFATFRKREGQLADQYGLIMNYYPLRGMSDFWGAGFGAGVQKTAELPLMLGASAELSADERFFARLGYERSAGSPLMRRLNTGLGFFWNGFGIDAAYSFDLGRGGHSGSLYAVNAKYQIESLKKRSADDNIALAHKHFERGRYGISAQYAERALAADSMHWNAQAMLRKSNTKLRQTEDVDIAIIYGGNSQGIIVPFPPSPDALGGLSRHAAVVSSLRQRYPVNFAIDAGNLLNAENNNPLRQKLTAHYYDAMNFDMIAPGGGEAAIGPLEFMRAQKRPLPVIITNLNDNDSETSGIWSSLLLTKDGYSVYMLNLLTRSVLNDGIARNYVYNPAALRSQINTGRAAEADLRVAVVHGSISEVRRMAENLPELDLIIAGSLEERFDTPLKIGNTLIVSAGAGNKFAGCITFKFNARRRGTGAGRFTAVNRLHPVYQDIAPDTAIENITGLVAAAVNVEESRRGLRGRDKVPLRVRGVIPHLSDRGSGPQAFIKAIESQSEHPLGQDGFVNSRRPTLSAANNRAAFIFGQNSAGNLRMADMSTMSGRTVSSGRNVLEAAFSPTDNFLYYIEADSGSEAGAIYKTRMYMFEAIPVLWRDGSIRRDLSVSNDGATLFFTSAPAGGNRHIYAVDTSAAAAPVRLTSGNANHRLPRPSPNGKFVAYLSDRNTFAGRSDLWIFERGSNTHKQITVNANVQDFTWADDSELIYFSSGTNMFDISSVYVNHIAAIRKLITPPAGEIKIWHETAPRFLRYAGAPKILYTREYLDGTRQLYWYDITNGKDEKLYATGDYDEWLD